LSNPSSTGTTNPAIPTPVQLADARSKQWHQQGEALLTIENLRSWINAAGLVLYAPRPQIAAPAPSLVEAVLGAPNSSPTLEESAAARSLLARLIAEGLAVPLNLLGAVNGAVGEMPDFVASTAVFSYVFTLRGDKAWKQPPATTGAVKVSHLALAVHEALSQRGPLSAYDLTTEVGKEVTEAAVLRALAELWTHLRVLPLPQIDGRPALWELATARFTKQIKAGANAGQPSALSALISLYLGQAIVASEDDIESFLSPLAPRSRIRDVVHTLLSARQLDTLAVEGRTMVHVAGALPVFLAPEPVPAAEAELVEVAEIAAVADATDAAEAAEADGDTPSITKYVPKPRKIGTGYLAKAKPAKFASKPSPRTRPDGGKPEFGGPAKPAYKPRSGPAPDRERRPFQKPAAPSGPRGFDKPWDEDKPRRTFAPRADGEGDARPPRKSFSKPGTFGRKREGFEGKPKFGGESRPPRRDFAPRPDRGEGGERPKFAGSRSSGSYTPRPRGDRPQGDRPPRAEGSGFAPRKSFGSKPGGGGFGSKPAGGGFKARPGFSKDRGDRPAYKPREGSDRFTTADSGKRVYRKFDAPRDREERPARPYSSDRPARPYSSDRPARPAGAGGYAGKPKGDFAKRKPSGDFVPRRPSGKPGGSFAGKKPFGKPGGGGFSDKPTSTFAKFVGNKKPFGKKAPARKYKPKEDE
jgi:hypothetical protein